VQKLLLELNLMVLLFHMLRLIMIATTYALWHFTERKLAFLVKTRWPVIQMHL